MVSVTLIVLSNPSQDTASAATNTTTIPSNLLQYEWTQINSNVSHSFASDGPGPNTFNIKWRTQILGAVTVQAAFNGKLFVQDKPNYMGQGQTTYCLDASTGQILWKNAGVIGTIVKLDENYMLVGNGAYKISDGSFVYTLPFSQDRVYPPAYGNLHLNGITPISGCGYDPATKVYFTGSIMNSAAQAWYFGDTSKAPTLLWDRVNQTDYLRYGTETANAYSQGIVTYYTSYGYLLGVNATTGKTIWATPTQVTAFNYPFAIEDGVIGFGSLSGTFYGWNLTTGELMWTYNSGSYMNQFASAVGAAYGIFFEHNQDTYVYAINATTGELIWRTNAPGTGISYSNSLTIAGGKVYVQMGENQYIDPATGNPGRAEYYCINAYTGELVWSAPLENGAPQNSQVNAYGNLYVVPMVTSYHPDQFVYAHDRPNGGINGTDGTLSEVWCISDTTDNWSMQFNDAAHSSFGNGPTKLSIAWDTALGGSIVSSPTIVNGVAYVGAYDGNIYALNAATGEKIWNYSTGTIGFSSTLAVVNNKVYTGADDGNVYCIEANAGTKVWQASAGGLRSLGSPIVSGEKLYVGAANGILYCYDASTGSVHWTYNTGGSITQTPTVDSVNDCVYVPSRGTRTGQVFKINATTGALIYNVSIPCFQQPVIGASVSIGGGMIFVRADYVYNYALNATDGQVVWKFNSTVNAGTPEQANGVSQSCAILYQYGRVYLNNYFSISCLNAFTGKELWNTYLARENVAQGLSYSYGRIYTVNENGVLFVLDSLSGAKLSYYQFAMGGAELHSTPTPYNGSLYVGSLDWNLYCFNEAIPTTIATTSITFELRPSSLVKGETTIVAGNINSVQSAVPINVYFSKGDSSLPVNISAVTDANGGFIVKYAPDMVGEWSVAISFAGDATHNACSSQLQTLTVTEPATTAPTQTQQSMADLYFIPAVIAIIIAIVVVGLVTIFALKKRL